MADWAGHGGQPGMQQGGYQQISQRGIDGFLEDLGDRVNRRAEPRLGITLAAVGMLMVLVGILVWAGERLGESDIDGGGSDPDRTLGIFLSLAVIVAGYFVLLRVRRGPLATAGVIASAIGVPFLLGFASYDPVEAIVSSTDFDDEFSSTPMWQLPFSADAIALLSLAVWLISYTRVPAAKGRAFYLAASSLMLWLYLLEKVEEGAAGWIVTLPFSWLFFPIFDEFGTSPEPPDPSVIGGWSLLFASLYYGGAFLLDRAGRRGVATPLCGAALVIAALGIGHLADDLKEIGTGVLLLIVGSVLAFYGATQSRRITTWGWSLAAGLGVLLIIGQAFDDSAAGFGVSAILLGLAVVAVAHFIADYYSEPDEMEPGPSRFTPKRPGPPAAWAAYAGYPGYPPQPGQPYPGQPYPPPTAPQPTVTQPTTTTTGEWAQPGQPAAPQPPNRPSAF